ncbi:MAG: iron chaperone [Bacteroidota bacterium]
MNPGKTAKKKATQKSAKTTAASGDSSKGFSDEEKAAMRSRAREMKAEARSEKDKAAGESAALEAIAAMQEPDRSMAKRIHAIIKESAPGLSAKTWYGMPAYANNDGKVVCFFQTAQKFNTRYSTLGFNDSAKLDEGAMWPVAFALKKLTAADEARIGALLKKAVS